jgi:hypothetical protein
MFYQWFWWFLQDFSGFFKISQDFSRYFMFYSRSWIISYYILLKIYSSFINDFDEFFKIFQDFSWISRFFILSDPIWSYLIQLQMSPGDLSLFISSCHFLRFSLFFYVLFKILIILSPIPIDYQSLVMYFTIQF